MVFCRLLVTTLPGHETGNSLDSLLSSLVETIELLYQPVFNCTPEVQAFLNLTTCDGYAEGVAEDMKQRSYDLSIFWTIVIVICVVGNLLTAWGFGNASERMTRRIRDMAFDSLVRQEVAYFDKRSVGKITSQLQEDATQIQTFTGDPIRQVLISLASVLVGLVVAFYVSFVRGRIF